ncbi:MAG: putative bifunctional diguanylate cyclase/phosphodiesterase [Myxococcales bacterium]
MLFDDLQLLREVLGGLQLLAVMRDGTGKIDYCNEPFLRATGYALDEVRGKDWFELFVPADQREVRRLEESELRGISEQAILTRSGESRHIRWTLTPLRDHDGKTIGSAGVGADVTALKHDPFHDPLTGLPNRALFIDRLSHRLALEQRRPRASFAVLFLDIDRFKVINDSLGHVRGDEVLLEVGRRLQSCLRPHDTVARLGGDEFGVLLEDVPDAPTARKVADRLQDALKAPFIVHGQEIFCGASIGIAQGNATYARPEDIMRDADTALYRAKGQGRGRWVEFDSTMHDRAVEVLQLETDLRRAVERRELLLHYQPVVSLSSGEIVGAEALIRWRHPDRGLVAPAEFIPLAEEMGLIVRIGAWVLGEACRQMKLWQDRLGPPNLEIGVNLSSKQFQAPGLVAEVGRVLRDTGLSPRSLRLEVTESLLMDRHPQVADAMTGLRAMGVRIDLDDFGTGYSSLSYLHQFPIDTLKIDRSFIARLGTTADGLEIVHTILALAQSLDMDVVAEGVETAEQLQLLRNLHCAYAQGYYLSRPVDSDDFEALLGERRSWAA